MAASAKGTTPFFNAAPGWLGWARHAVARPSAADQQRLRRAGHGWAWQERHGAASPEPAPSGSARKGSAGEAMRRWAGRCVQRHAKEPHAEVWQDWRGVAPLGKARCVLIWHRGIRPGWPGTAGLGDARPVAHGNRAKERDIAGQAARRNVRHRMARSRWHS